MLLPKNDASQCSHEKVAVGNDVNELIHLTEYATFWVRVRERSSCFPKIAKIMLWHCCLFQMFLWFLSAFDLSDGIIFSEAVIVNFSPPLFVFKMYNLWNTHTFQSDLSKDNILFVSLWDFLIPARNKTGNKFLTHSIKVGMKELENYLWYIITLFWDNYKKIARHSGNFRFPKCIQMVVSELLHFEFQGKQPLFALNCCSAQRIY